MAQSAYKQTIESQTKAKKVIPLLIDDTKPRKRTDFAIYMLKMAETDRDDILHTKSGQEGQLLPSQFDLDGQPGDYPTLQRHQVVDLGSNLYSDRSSYVENPIQAGTVEISNDESPRKIQIPSPARQFSLQEAPVIDRGLGIQSIDYGEEENDGFDMHVTSPFSVTKNSLPLQSPHSVMGNHEPSPQLPPPASSNSLKHIANDEVATLRKKLVTETKTPAEYTLHIIFTQFVRHAERKLNMCLEFPENAEHPIIDILGEGADPQFDKIIANLGYIARRKPKPVIDSVMFWRKSKNEVAALAANEVGRLVNEQSTKDPQQMAQNSTEQPKPRAKRSLSLMKSKSIYRMTGAHRRNQSSSSMPPAPLKTSEELTRVLLDKKRDSLEESISLTRETAIQASRKSLALIFILCRVLIEVVKQTSFDNDDLGDKLEEIVYTQLKSTDPVATSQSLVRSANWNLFSELLGIMSEKRFMSVSDRFIADLETIPLVVNQEDEPRLHLLIHGMRYLKLTNYPLENFEESADFLHSLSKFFAKTRNECLIFAYCEVLSCLMIPLANTLTAEVNHPTWLEAVERIFDTGYRLWYNIAKSTLSSQNVSLVNPSNGLSMHPSMYANNSWALSMYLMTSALSVSRNEHFSKVWFQIIEGNTYKLKAKVDPEEKATFIICIARLIWVYLYRLPESLNNTVKRLESLFDILFFNSSNYNKKQHWLTSDYYLINALVQLIRIVGYQHLNFVLDNVLLKLLKSPSLGSERLLFVLKSYLLIVEDHEMGNKPVFPTDKVFSSRILVEDFSVNTKQNAPKGKEEQSRKKNVTINDFLFKARNSNNAASHDEICRTLGIFLKTLDEKLGCVIVPPEQSGNMSKSLSPFSAFNFGIENAFQQVQDVDIELFATLIDAIPWTMISQSEKPSASGLSFKAIVDLLTRNAVHSNPRVSKASVQALHNLASKKNANILLSIFAKIAFQFSEKPGPSYSSNYFNSNEYLKLCKVYVGLLNCWLVQFKETLSETKEKKNPLAQDDETMNRDVLNDLYQINYKTDDIPLNTETSQRTNDDFEWKNIITAIEEIEGNALYFICSLDAKIRHYGISILKLVELFDQVIYKITDENEVSLTTKRPSHSRSASKFAADIGTRLIDVMENIDFFGLIRPMKNELSLAETSRLAKWKNKSNTLIKLAESDHGIDTTLWFRVYPKMLEIFFERCPMPVAMCRLIICIRIVQMHELVYEFSESYNSFTNSFFSKSTDCPPEVLVSQWRLYLIFACCSLTSTNEQKISFPSQPTHGRKKSMQLFIQHQKITSAKSVFRMVLPLLKTQRTIIRDAVISGLSCVNVNTFRTFLENIPETLNDWNTQSSRRDAAEDRLRIEVIHVLSNLTKRLGPTEAIYKDEWIVKNLVAMIKHLKTFLSDPSIQTNAEFQKLRRFFCIYLEHTFIGLQKNTNIDQWFPFEARIGCFNYLKEWSLVGEFEDIAEDRYRTMVNKANQKEVTAATIEIEKKAFQHASLSCMAVLCSGPVKQEIELPGQVAVMSFDIPGVMAWIHSLFSSDQVHLHDIGKSALSNLLAQNFHVKEIYQEVVRQCYTSQKRSGATGCYFVVFAENYMKRSIAEDQEKPYEVLCLSTYLVGNESYNVRSVAVELLNYLEAKHFQNHSVDKFVESVHSKSKVVYKKALYDISASLALLGPTGSFIRISYLTRYFNVVDSSSRRDILSCLLPWVLTISLEYESEKAISTQSEKPRTRKLNGLSTMVLNNLFEITVNFSSKIPNEVEALWVALAAKPEHFDMVVDFLINNCLERRNSRFVQYALQVINYLAFSQSDQSHLIVKLISNLQARNMVPTQMKGQSSNDQGETHFPYEANLWEIVPSSDKDTAFSLGQLSFIFLRDIFVNRHDQMVEHLPLLLHVTFSLFDHYLPVVQEQATTILIHLIHALVPEVQQGQDLIRSLRNKDSKNLWFYDDLSNDKRGAQTPKNMDLLVRKVFHLFTPLLPTLQYDWSRVSLNWATTCAVRHIACRSFQIFRSLFSFLDQGMLRDMLHRLSNTVSDDTADIQGFALQILMTLNAITAELDSAKLIDFPQLFWSSVACLSTIHEQEFIEVLSTMSKFISKIDLDAPDTVSCLISTFPRKWEGKFEGLHQVVMVGLRSSTSWEPSIKFLEKLNKLNDSDILGSGKSRLLLSLLANLPRYLHALELKDITPDIETSAMTLSKMADANSLTSLSRILVSMSKNRFRSKKDFLTQTVSTIRTDFFPDFEAQTLVTLLSFLSNKIPWIKQETMGLLSQILPAVNLQRDEFVGVGADLISPLLRLLLTDFAEQALEVLDEAVVISGSQLDKDMLRMSLGNSTLKKEYEKTATLFGIPDENGWGVPMPAVTAGRTRNNVHAVFSTCVVAPVGDENEGPEALDDEDIQFHREDYTGDYGDTISVNVDDHDATLSNVRAALDDFDSFFTKENGGHGNGIPNPMTFASKRRDNGRHNRNISQETGHSNSSDPITPMDSVPLVYDNKASVILNRSLARTQSNSSFKTSLADSIGNTNYVSSPSNVARRSYIPFRSSRHNTPSMNKNEGGFTSPLVPAPTTFEIGANYRSSPYSREKTSPSTTSPTLSVANALENASHEKKFEGLLHGKIRSKRPPKGSPGSPKNSPDLQAKGHWARNTST